MTRSTTVLRMRAGLLTPPNRFEDPHSSGPGLRRLGRRHPPCAAGRTQMSRSGCPALPIHVPVLMALVATAPSPRCRGGVRLLPHNLQNVAAAASEFASIDSCSADSTRPAVEPLIGRLLLAQERGRPTGRRTALLQPRACGSPEAGSGTSQRCCLPPGGRVSPSRRARHSFRTTSNALAWRSLTRGAGARQRRGDAGR